MRKFFDLKHLFLAVIASACAYASFGSSGFTNRGTIGASTPAGKVLQGNTIYTVKGSPKITADHGESGLAVAENATAVIYIPQGEKLTVTGGDADKSNGAGAGIRVPTNSTLVVCGEGKLEATGGEAYGDGLAAPFGVGSGGTARGAPGSAAGIGGDGESDDSDPVETDLGELYLFGRLSVTAVPGNGASPPPPATTNGIFSTSVAETARPTLVVGGGRQPNCHIDTHPAILYEVIMRDALGNPVSTNAVALAMPYPEVRPPTCSNDWFFVGYTNSLGRLVIGPGGKPTTNLCTQAYDHEIYAVRTQGANTTADQDPAEISYTDDVVSLREALEIFGISLSRRVAPTNTVPIAPILRDGTANELVFHVNKYPLNIASPAEDPVHLDGLAAGSRPMVIEGGTGRTNPLFNVPAGQGFKLLNLTVRNTSGSVDGVAVLTETNSELVAENVLFESIDAGVGCGVRATGTSRFLRTTFRHCAGKPLSIGESGYPGFLIESTVVPLATGAARSTGNVSVGANGAAMACTAPSGIQGAGSVVGSYTDAITAELFNPAEPLSETVDKVRQYYYKPLLSSGFVAKGVGCFVCHDEMWTNVAWMAVRNDTRTAVLGDPSLATEIYDYDVRNVKIDVPRNTRGSYAFAPRSDRMAANTTEDQHPGDLSFDDDVVSLREAVLMVGLLAPSQASRLAYRVQIDPSLVTNGTGAVVFTLFDNPILPLVIDGHPVALDGIATAPRPLVIDGGKRTTSMFRIVKGGGLKLTGVTLRNASGTSADGGLAVAVDAGGWFCAENCRFSDIRPSSDDVSCVRALGAGGISFSTWADCPGCPFDIGADGGRFTLAESTVVPYGTSTRPGKVRSGGAVMACTIPSGVNATGTGAVLGSYTEPITAEKFQPTTVMTTTVDRVELCYYLPNLTGGLARKGEGCFVWHDDNWSNVAWSVTADEAAKTAVFGSSASASTRIGTDIRSVRILFPWNTRGSTAVRIRDGSYEVNTTDDQEPAEITADDAVVSLREEIELLSILSADPTFGQPASVTFADSLLGRSGDLVFTVGSSPIPVSAALERPLVLNGAAMGTRPLVIDGGGARTAPMFTVPGNAAFCLRNATLRNASGAGGKNGLAIVGEADSRTLVENCLFSGLEPAADVASVHSAGSGAILRSSWKDCSGRPLVTAGDGRFALVESTVVPYGTATRPISLSAGGAVLASTVPCGVEAASGAVVAGSQTDAITAAKFCPTEPQSVTVDKVTQYYYRAGLCGGLAKKGAGCFVWHDPHWVNVAKSVTTNEATKTAVFGSAASATNRIDRDVRNVAISFPWNTCGSYAVGVGSDSYDVTTTVDEDPATITTDDATVSLREAIELQNILSPEPAFGQPDAITFADALTGGSGNLVFYLGASAIPVSATSEHPLVLDGAAAAKRPVLIDGGGARTEPMFTIAGNAIFRLRNVTVRNASGASGEKGLAIAAEADSRMLVENCLFSGLSPATDVASVHSAGSGSILRSSWKDCSGRPLVTAGGRFALAESTVVPKTGTQPISLSSGGAVLASTVPSGVTAASGAVVAGSITSAITAGMCYPTTAQSVTVDKVMQYYYKVCLCSGLAKKGTGCFVWHDADWANVAKSVTTDAATKTAVFGDRDLATARIDRDVRNVAISFPWNTCGSYAVALNTSSAVVTTTSDQKPEEIVTDDTKVSLREAIELLCILSPEGSTESRAVTFSQNLVSSGKDDLVFKLNNYPIVVSSAKAAPLILSGDAASGRMVVIDGNGSHAQEMFSVTNGCGFCLQSVALRNASGASGRKGLAIAADEGSFLSVSNCLFSSLDPAPGVACVHAAGAGAIGQVSWSECSRSPANIGAAGGTFTLFESTVVPKGADGTQPVTVNAGGAVVSCTLPNGLTVNSGGQSIANHTGAITSTDFDPTDVLSTNLSRVTQYYYKVKTGSALMKKGEGRFVWHDPIWANVAVSVLRTDTKTAVFGSVDAAKTVSDRDVRGHPIVYPWNTRGSYAVTCSHYPTDVNTTDDPDESTFDYEDDVVSLREALHNLTIMPGLVSRQKQIPNEVTFADSLFKKGATTLRLVHGALEVGEFPEDTPLRVAAPGDGRVVKLDLESEDRAFDIESGTHVVLSGLDLVNGRADFGGAVRTQSPLTVERCRFAANTATAAGGAIYAGDTAGVLTLRDSVFEANGMTGGDAGGGAVQSDCAKLLAVGCTFTGNVTESSDGGAIHATDNCSATISNCVFSGNTGCNTGAVCARGTLTVVSSKFTGNESTSSKYGGGAIWSDHNATIRLCDFAGNVSAGSGGALRVEQADDATDVRSCLFEDNVSVKSGGALYCQGALTLNGSTFRANRVTDTSSFGGAVVIDSKEASITRCRFEKNVSACGGGALRVGKTGDPVLVFGSTFVGNVAERSDGGAISFNVPSGKRYFTVVNSSFFENASAKSGGAISSSHTDCLLANVTMTGNQATLSGGGLYADNTSSAYALVNVLASGNPGPTVTSSTADVCGYGSGWKVCNVMIRKGGSLATTKAKWIFASNSASEGNIFASDGEKYREIANGASQLARRLRDPDYYPNPNCGAVIRHSDDWRNVSCDCYGIKRGTASREILVENVSLRSGSDTMHELRSDITGRTFFGYTPGMGSLWNVPDSVSGEVSTLADVSDAKDGAVSLREILANLKAEPSWRTSLYDATCGGYRLTFKEGLAGTLKLNGCALLVEGLDGVPVFLEGPTDRPITIDGQSRFRGLTVGAGERLEISNLTFTNCCTPKGAIDYDGGGIRNAGTLVATDVAFYTCTAGQTRSAPEGWGGAVSTLAGATSRLERCTFVGNVAAHGGAVAVHDGGRLTVAGATFEGNSVVASGSFTEVCGSAAYVEGATTDALFAHCTFANNTGVNHATAHGGAAVYADNRGASPAKTVLVNCVVAGNGGVDLATTGRMRLIGTTYGVRTALDGAADETLTWHFNTTEAATCTNGLATADVYAHTQTNGMPAASVRRCGQIVHTVVPLAVRENPFGSVFLRAEPDWSLVAWSATSAKNGTKTLLRGTSAIGAKNAPLVTTDQLGESTGGTASWPGAMIRCEAKDVEDPPPVGPEPGAITEATYEALLDAIATARSLSPEDAVVFVTETTSNETIAVPSPIALTGSGRVTIRGPLTLDAAGSGRIFSVPGGVTLRLEELTLTGGDATVHVSDEDAGAGGAVYLDSEDKSMMAKLEAEKCTFTGNRAYYGGAVAAFGLGCAESFTDCTFPPGLNFADYDSEWDYGGEGAAIYHDDNNLTISGGTIDLNEIWPKPAYAVTTPAGATALFGSADVPDPGDSSVGPDDLSAPFEDAQAYAGTAGAGAKVVPLTTAAVAAKAAAAGVPAAAIEEEMTPEVTEITISTAAGSADGEVSIAPQNLVPFMTYSIEYASSPDALGTSAAQSGNKVQADASGRLAAPLTAPATGDSGFYRVIAE